MEKAIETTVPGGLYEPEAKLLVSPLLPRIILRLDYGSYREYYRDPFLHALSPKPETPRKTGLLLRNII